MKTITALILCLIYTSGVSQSLINSYFDNYNFTSISSNDITALYLYPPKSNYNAPNTFGFLFTPHFRNHIPSSSFDGEYQICIDQFPWFINSSFQILHKSFSIEVVSYPFTTSCWDQQYGCTSNSSNNNPPLNRDLQMPTDPYIAINHSWLNLKSFIAIPLQHSSMSQAATLITRRFIDDEWPLTLPGNYLPHTILKQSIYLHCTASNSSSIIDSISWVYDNTRGAMRGYPFKNNNLPVASPAAGLWDVMFRPEILTDLIDIGLTSAGYDYSQTGNDNWYEGGSLNYYPFSNVISNCNPSILTPLAADQFIPWWSFNPLNPMEYRADDYLFKNIPPYALLFNGLKDAYGVGPVGYSVSNYQYNSLLNLKHNYFIDQNIDLNIINPAEKLIYNPSEVSITANDLLFPAGYTFKTIRGMYPSVSEVMADDLAENGGSFADLRDVPVRTDLRSENSNDPNDPNDISNSVYAGRYYLLADSKLTIANCVKLFDCAFDVNTGATLIINDYPQLLGKEHVNGGLGRYKLIGKGGAVLRNYKAIQYVQNGLINQQFPLVYKA